MRRKTKKAIFNLHTDVPATLDQIVTQGMAASRNIPVEPALNQELKYGDDLKTATEKLFGLS